MVVTEADMVLTPFQKWSVFFSMCLAIFIVAFATTATTNAMVPISTQLDLTPTQLQWTTNAYILGAATLMVLGGLLSDRFGRRNMDLLGGSIFVAGSIMCALADSGAMFILGRFVQGVGVAVIMPGTLALMKISFPENQQNIVTTGWACAVGLGMGLGPFLSGVFCKWVTWNALFWLVCSVMLFALIVLVIAEHQRTPQNKSITIDFWGLIAFMVGFGLFVFAFVEGSGMGWDSPLIISFLVVGVLVMCCQPWLERHVNNTPFLDFDYFKRPRFLLGCIGMFVNGYLLISILFFGSLYLQNPLLQNYTVYQAGLAVIPAGFGLSFSVLFVDQFIKRIGLANCIHLLNFILIVGVIWFMCLGLKTSYVLVWEPFFLIGSGCGMAMKAFPAMGMQALSAKEAARASSVVSVCMYIGVIIATTIGTILSTNIGRIEFFSRTAQLSGVPFFTKLRLEKAMVGHPTAISHILTTAPTSLREALQHAVEVSALKGFQYAMIGCLVCSVGLLIATFILSKLKKYDPTQSTGSAA